MAETSAASVVDSSSAHSECSLLLVVVVRRRLFAYCLALRTGSQETGPPVERRRLSCGLEFHQVLG